MRATITVLRAHLTSVWKCAHFTKPYFSIDFSLVIATATTVVPVIEVMLYSIIIDVLDKTPFWKIPSLFDLPVMITPLGIFFF
jgi:hypothetical protein